MMTEEKPRILKKVEQFSNEISDFVIDPKHSDKPIEIKPLDITPEEQDMLFMQDFRVIVYAKQAGCSCYYKGERIACEASKKANCFFAGKEDKNLQWICYSLFPTCKVRQYAKLCANGFLRKMQAREQE